MSDDTNRTACSEKWTTAECRLSFTIHGQWVTTSTRLNTNNAGTNRASTRTARSSAGGRSTQRMSHAGVPRSSSGAATIANVRCCTMWTL